MCWPWVGIFTNTSPTLPNATPPFQLAAEEPEEIEVHRKKYAKSGLNEDRAQDLHQRLEELMHDEKLFTEPELTLTDLANRLEIHPNYLSQVINEVAGVNFYDYINHHRVEEFKRQIVLPHNQRFTLLAIAYDCGFNSKSAFNRYFKKMTGFSPSDYVKQHRAVGASL